MKMKQGTTEQIVFKFAAGEAVDVTDKTPKEVEEIEEARKQLCDLSFKNKDRRCTKWIKSKVTDAV